jgi:hypothetical protein
VDNTLWKGLVLTHEKDLQHLSPDPAEYGKPDRMAKMALSMHNFNTFVKSLTSTAIPIESNVSTMDWLAGVDDVLKDVSTTFSESPEVVTASDLRFAFPNLPILSFLTWTVRNGISTFNQNMQT